MQMGQHLCIFITDSDKDVKVGDESGGDNIKTKHKNAINSPDAAFKLDLEMSPLTILAEWIKKVNKDSTGNAYRNDCRILYCRKGHVIQITPFKDSVEVPENSDDLDFSSNFFSE